MTRQSEREREREIKTGYDTAYLAREKVEKFILSFVSEILT